MSNKTKNLADLLDEYARSSNKSLSFAEFKTIVHQIARTVDAEIEKMDEAGVTPNFHTAVLKFRQETVGVFISAVFPLIAFGQAPFGANCKIDFVDHSKLADAFGRVVPQFKVMQCSELNSPFADSELFRLDPQLQKEIAYWKPRTFGEIVFNWWD